jgi:hypothetical protein
VGVITPSFDFQPHPEISNSTPPAPRYQHTLDQLKDHFPR